MDAVEYVKAMKRMCESHDSKCRDCLLSTVGCGYSGDVEAAVAIVEDWAKEHPIVTNAEKLVEVFGKIRLKDITPEWLKQEYREPEGKDEA